MSDDGTKPEEVEVQQPPTKKRKRDLSNAVTVCDLGDQKHKEEPKLKSKPRKQSSKTEKTKADIDVLLDVTNTTKADEKKTSGKHEQKAVAEELEESGEDVECDDSEDEALLIANDDGTLNVADSMCNVADCLEGIGENLISFDASQEELFMVVESLSRRVKAIEKFLDITATKRKPKSAPRSQKKKSTK